MECLESGPRLSYVGWPPVRKSCHLVPQQIIDSCNLSRVLQSMNILVRASRACAACLTAFLVTACGSDEPDAARHGVRADLFTVQHQLRGDTLILSLQTDLPPETELIVSGSRMYLQVGDQSEYSIDYFSDRGRIADWVSPRRFTVRESVWRDSLRAKQRLLARAGMPFTVRSVSDSLEIDFVVHINQTDTRFGEQDRNLFGDAVTTNEVGNLITRRLALPRTAPPVIADDSPIFVRADDLQPGKAYSFSKEISLMPELEPADPWRAIEQIRVLPVGTRLHIRRRENHDNTLWYEVIARDDDGQSLGAGWVNSIGLLGGDIVELDRADSH
jgi:hypothetical protein